MFWRSSTRRTTCPACGSASRGPMAGQASVASGVGTGSVTLRDCRRNGPGPVAGHAGFATLFTTIVGQRPPVSGHLRAPERHPGGLFHFQGCGTSRTAPAWCPASGGQRSNRDALATRGGHVHYRDMAAAARVEQSQISRRREAAHNGTSSALGPAGYRVTPAGWRPARQGRA
jgi:hypothetical protein